MVGRSRVRGLERAFAPGAVACLALAVGTGFVGCNQPGPSETLVIGWTTDEQAAELRRDGLWFTRSERPGMGPGLRIQGLPADRAGPNAARTGNAGTAHGKPELLSADERADLIAFLRSL